MMALVLIKQLLILSEGLLNFKRQSKKPIITSPCEYLKSKKSMFFHFTIYRNGKTGVL